jgi:hypothetical protein
MTASSLFHRFLFSIVLAAPFYNLMKSSENRLYIISGVLIILNIILNLIAERSKRSVLFRPVSLEKRAEVLKKLRSARSAREYKTDAGTDEERLKTLKDLFEKGLISETDYSEKKREIINGI